MSRSLRSNQNRYQELTNFDESDHYQTNNPRQHQSQSYNTRMSAVAPSQRDQAPQADHDADNYPQQYGRDPPDDGDDDPHAQHNNVRMYAISSLSTTRDSVPVFVIAYIAWNIIELIVLLTIMFVNMEPRCGTYDFHGWMIGKCIRNLIVLPFHVRRLKSIPSTIGEQKFMQFMNLMNLVILICSRFVLDDRNNCQKMDPSLFWTMVSSLIFLGLYALLPFLLLLCICLCLPCLLLVLRRMGVAGDIPHGATKDQIDELPEFNYTLQEYKRRKLGITSDDGDVETGRESAQPLHESGEHRHDSSDDEPACPICLIEYEEGEILRVLPCKHIYHKSCVDNWLPLNRTCPTCRRPIVTE